MRKLLLCLIAFCTILALTAQVEALEIWDSDFIQFTKGDYTDWQVEVNQDRITDNVWITRGDDAGLFNAAVESWIDGIMGSGWNGEPSDTEWAIGTTADYDTLIYEDWVDWVDLWPGLNILDPGYNPAVLHLITDDIYIDITFTQWTMGGGGGFSYSRASAGAPVPEPATMLLLGSGLLGLAGFRRKFRKR